MSWVVPVLLVVVIGVPLVIAFARMGELFVLRVRGGRVEVVRGRVPPRLLDDLRNVLRGAKLDGTVLRCVVEEGRAVIRPRGGEVPAALRQRLRNTLALWPVAKIRSAPRHRS
ncbi:MAG: DUF3634 family protein [Deltaproteobacteria bacterium]|jgi:hypothetical protein|nr:DUF3634 family protein [Deltaproteobacteria bacterium]